MDLETQKMVALARALAIAAMARGMHDRLVKAGWDQMALDFLEQLPQR